MLNSFLHTIFPMKIPYLLELYALQSKNAGTILTAPGDNFNWEYGISKTIKFISLDYLGARQLL